MPPQLILLITCQGTLIKSTLPASANRRPASLATTSLSAETVVGGAGIGLRSHSPANALRMHVLATAIPLTCLAAIAVVLRLYTRLHILKRLGYDDYTIIASLVSYLHPSHDMVLHDGDGLIGDGDIDFQPSLFCIFSRG